MKKMGFTLAEVLITISIVGVIAALTIPQFTANVHNQSFASKLSPIVTDYENIFGMMLLREDRENIFETPFGMSLGVATANPVTSTTSVLEDYTKITNSQTSGSIAGGTYKTINNTSVATGMTYVRRFEIPSGAVLMFFSPAGTDKNRYARLFIDVNGPAAPNKYGRDLFAFCLATDGHLYPFGSRQAAMLIRANNTTDQTWDNANSSNSDLKCTGAVSSYNGLGCTARLIENNYKVDY